MTMTRAHAVEDLVEVIQDLWDCTGDEFDETQVDAEYHANAILDKHDVEGVEAFFLVWNSLIS